jgi:hypothetical protein
MRTISKIVLCIVIFMIFGLITVALKGGQNRPGVGGPIGIILMFGMFAAMRAIWKYKPENPEKTNLSSDSHTLNKNS